MCMFYQGHLVWKILGAVLESFKAAHLTCVMNNDWQPAKLSRDQRADRGLEYLIVIDTCLK